LLFSKVGVGPSDGSHSGHRKGTLSKKGPAKKGAGNAGCGQAEGERVFKRKLRLRNGCGVAYKFLHSRRRALENSSPKPFSIEVRRYFRIKELAGGRFPPGNLVLNRSKK